MRMKVFNDEVKNFSHAGIAVTVGKKEKPDARVCCSIAVPASTHTYMYCTY